MQQYLDLVRHIRENGRHVPDDRTGVGTYKVFGYQMRFPDIGKNFPLVTAKYTPIKSIWYELEMFLRGITTVRFLNEHGVKIWNDNVIPGTEVWEYHNAEQIGEEIKKKFGYKSVAFYVIDSHQQFRLGDNGPLISLKDDTVWKFFNANGMMLLKDNESSPAEQVDLFVIGNTKHFFGDSAQDCLNSLAHMAAEYFGVQSRALIDGQLGPMYGEQWRRCKAVKLVEMSDAHIYGARGYQCLGEIDAGNPVTFKSDEDHDGNLVMVKYIDQIAGIIESLRKNPSSRRHVVDAWNVADLDEMALSPCHALFQFDAEPLTLRERAELFTDDENNLSLVEDNPHMLADILDREGVPKYRLNCQLYQRSADVFLGVPFNIASYALLTMMVAQCVDMVPGDFIWTGGDTHLYANHMEQVEELLTRSPLTLPKVTLNPAIKNIDDFKFEDVFMDCYIHYPHIYAPMAK